MIRPADHPEAREWDNGTVRMLGFWIVSVDGPLAVCTPQTLVGEPYTSGERAELVRFLRGGSRYLQFRGYSWCRCACDAPVPELGSGHWRRGDWAWPEGFAHYVEAHGVRVPEELERAAFDGARLERPDSSGLAWWIAWCTRRLPSNYTQRLARARADLVQARLRAQEEGAAEVRDAARAMERAEGTEPTRCLKLGCEERALTRRALCAWHVLTINGNSELEGAVRAAEGSPCAGSSRAWRETQASGARPRLRFGSGTAGRERRRRRAQVEDDAPCPEP
ncbi:MAG: hypothetical protein R3F62_12600 [Planctomycetota bacterium]